MAKDVCDHVDVTGLVVEGGSVGAAQFVRGKLFGKTGVFAVFFYHVLDTSDRQAAMLERYEQSGILFSIKEGRPLVFYIVF